MISPGCVTDEARLFYLLDLGKSKKKKNESDR